MSRSPRTGIGRVEVVLIIAIGVVMTGLLLPAVRRVREPANHMKCRNNLKQLMIALYEYESMGRPSLYSSVNSQNAISEKLFPRGCLGPGATPEERLSWIVSVLPFMEQEDLYRQFNAEKGYAGNLEPARKRIGILHCPLSREVEVSDEVSHYVAMSGLGHDAATQPAGAPGNGFMGYDRPTSRAMITDGTSNTIALMETRFHPGPWARGGSATLRGFDPAGTSLRGDNPPFGGHADGINVAMADGSVRFLPSSIDPNKLAAAITIAGGELHELD